MMIMMLFAKRIVWVFSMTLVMINEYWQSFDRIGILNHKKVLKKNKLKLVDNNYDTMIKLWGF